MNDNLRTRAHMTAVGWLVMVVAVGCTATADGPTEPTSHGAAPTASDTPTDGPDEEVATTLASVGADFLDAVAPYDHDSYLNFSEFQLDLDLERQRRIADCVRAEGIDDYPIYKSPFDRSDRANEAYSRGQFPRVDLIEAEGFPFVEGLPDAEQPEPIDEAAIEVAARCVADLRGLSDDPDNWENEDVQEIVPEAALHDDLFVAWQAVIDEIETLPEVRQEVERFGECLVDLGIPTDNATGPESAFFSYVDQLRMQTIEEAGHEANDEQEAIMRQYGQMWAGCGRDLFELREQLRSGERREAFLQEHEATIIELYAAVHGAR